MYAYTFTKTRQGGARCTVESQRLFSREKYHRHVQSVLTQAHFGAPFRRNSGTLVAKFYQLRIFDGASVGFCLPVIVKKLDFARRAVCVRKREQGALNEAVGNRLLVDWRRDDVARRAFGLQVLGNVRKKQAHLLLAVRVPKKKNY